MIYSENHTAEILDGLKEPVWQIKDADEFSVVKEGKDYTAISKTMLLAGQSRSRMGAYKRLAEAIISYLEFVLETEPNNIEKCFNRGQNKT